MFQKNKMKNQIKHLQREIDSVEKKRTRSQAALVEAILTHTSPSDEDVDYFNRYTELINNLRNEMHELELKLSGI